MQSYAQATLKKGWFSVQLVAKFVASQTATIFLFFPHTCHDDYVLGIFRLPKLIFFFYQFAVIYSPGSPSKTTFLKRLVRMHIFADTNIDMTSKENDVIGTRSNEKVFAQLQITTPLVLRQEI